MAIIKSCCSLAVLAVQASARFGFSEIPKPDFTFSAAITAAAPDGHAIAVISSRSIECDQAAESLPRDIFKFVF